MAIEHFTSSSGSPVASVKAAPLNIEGVVVVILMVAAFLLPLVAFPSPFFSFQFSKTILFSLAITVSFILFLVSILKTSSFSFPAHFLPLTLVLLIIFSLVSSFFSTTPSLSIFGYGFETDTLIFLVLGFIYFFLVSVLFKTKEKIFYSYLLFFSALFLLALYHLARFFLGTDFLSFGLYTNVFANTVGKWNELGVFFGIGVILSLITLEMLRLSRLFKTLLYIAFGVSLFFIAVVNFNLVWIILGIFSLAFFIYLLSTAPLATEAGDEGGRSSSRRISWASLIVLLISVAFLLAGGVIGDYISQWVGASSFEVRPSWSATSDVVVQTLKENPLRLLLGAGPNRFSSQWLLSKPASVNTTTFWNTNFNYGIGVIPSSVVTVGVLGGLAWLTFLALFLFTGFKAVFSRVKDMFGQYLITSSFFVSLYLWIIAFFYVPGVAIVGLTFFFTGLFFAALIQEGVIPLKTLLFSDPKVSFISILLSVFLLIGSVSYGYVVVRNGLASAQFENGVVEASVNGNLDAAEAALLRAVAIAPSDVYYRSLSELNRIRINQIVSRTDASIESIQADFQRVFAGALYNAQLAVNSNQANHLNWLALGRVYEIAVAANIERDRAYQLAESAYREALARNPHGPSLYLDLARLETATEGARVAAKEITRADYTKAKEYIAGALAEKNNYTEAVFLLSQIEVSEGKIDDAISSVEGAAVLDPNNPLIYFQLGLLKYNENDFAGAASALEAAVALNGVYANAQYFLGLSYYELKRRDDAIAQFEAVAATNPNNQEVQFILENLKNGRSPFADVSPPLDDEPENRDTLPVEERE